MDWTNYRMPPPGHSVNGFLQHVRRTAASILAYTAAVALPSHPMLTRLPYTLLWILALPLVLLRLAWRARRQPAYLRHLGERFGRYRTRAPVGVIWVHAVSVGETRAAEPLVRALLAEWPEHSVLLTHMTPTGRETSKALFRDEARVLRAYLPYDLGCFAHAFLRHFRPLFGVVMETELWPNLLAACKRRRVPVMLANARLSERSARRYARLPALTALTLKALAAIGAQTAADASRLTQLGARRVTVTGNLKFDIAPPGAMLVLGRSLRERIGNRPVLLAASTREGEEALLLDASGFVSEDAGENLFVVKKGVVYTPDLSAGALNGITRDTIFAICQDLGLRLVEKRITRDEVYIADEAFFTGTAAEVTPIRELDRIAIGAGARGPITEKIQSAFFDIVGGRNAKYAEWLTRV